jgi:ankyrin repeat protein
VDLNLKTDRGQTALSLAAEKGHSEIVEMLLTRHDVDVNTQDLDGQTPLGWAVFNGHATVVADLLLNPEVRLDIRDVEGRTPLSRAIINRRDLILGLLLDRLGLCSDRRIRTALFKYANGELRN